MLSWAEACQQLSSPTKCPSSKGVQKVFSVGGPVFCSIFLCFFNSCWTSKRCILGARLPRMSTLGACMHAYMFSCCWLGGILR